MRPSDREPDRPQPSDERVTRRALTGGWFPALHKSVSEYANARTVPSKWQVKWHQWPIGSILGPVMDLHIQPLRDLVVVELEAVPVPAAGQLQVIRHDMLMRPARITACGPEVRDLRPGMRALVNTAAAAQVNGSLVVPESTIVATL